MTNRISAIDLDDRGLAAPTAEIDQERKVAIFDLLEDNSFAIPRAAEYPGPYHLSLAIREARLVFAISDHALRKSKPSTWHGAAFTTKGHGSCKNA